MTDRDLDRAANYAKAAIALLERTSIPPYPMYFELFYLYAAGTNKALTTRMNAVLESGQLDSGQATRLCEEFLEIPDVDGRLKSMSEAMTDKIGDVNSAIGAAMATATTYSGSLERATDTLTGDLDERGLKALSAKLLDETRRMQEMNTNLEGRLQASHDDMAALQGNLDMIRRESLTDPLTRIPNRKCFDERLAEEINSAEQSGSALSLILLDIDRFKAFNDTWGHLTGDQVLRLVAQVIRSSIRGRDLPARFGGEEFVVILPDTDLDGALAVAENIRRSVAAKELVKRSTNEKLGRLTLSAGVACLRSTDTSSTFIERADQGLYRAKSMGRNRVAGECDVESAGAPAVA